MRPVGKFSNACALQIFAYTEAELSSGAFKGAWMLPVLEEKCVSEKDRQIFQDMEYTLDQMLQKGYLERMQRMGRVSPAASKICGITEKGVAFMESITPAGFWQKYKKMTPSEKASFWIDVLKLPLSLVTSAFA